MSDTSPHQRVRHLEAAIARLLAVADAAGIATASNTARVLKRMMVDVRLDVRDYELAATRAEQLSHAREGRERLQALQTQLLALSQDGIAGPADVAHLSALIEQLSETLV